MGKEPQEPREFKRCRNVNEIAALLSGEIRLEFLRTLAHKIASVQELGEQFGLRQPCVSQNIGKLRGYGFVDCFREKKHCLCRIGPALEVAVECGSVYLKATSLDEDAVIVRTRIPFSTAPAQTVFWPWAINTKAARRNEA
ncbi:MAG: winged helix-turn-helix domain-containing protein [Phycisphaerales bacterium]|nr:winged helix-turn-helix domain-containing protein [Phycisphaerales bacterium]